MLAALQLGDSFFPSGMFTQSHGLEQFVARGLRDAAELAELLHCYLLDQAAYSDALAARWAVRAMVAADLDLLQTIDQRLTAFKLAPEARAASLRCGRQMLHLGALLSGKEELKHYADRGVGTRDLGNQAVALALLAWSAGLDEEAAVAVELHGFATSLVSAAVRLGICDHIGAQRLIWQARPVIAAAGAVGRELHWRDIGGFAPIIEQMQCRHAYAETHMFVS
ncbi:urease accessory protein [Candidatus Gracilibacteria bacterium]|nr:urease accessory protein [Candidatus Gracilibacteria bacterium]